MSLLELVIASSIMAVVMTTVMVVLRTGRQAWEAHEGDCTRIEAAHATLRHVVRQIRQADRVTDIKPDRLTLELPGGDSHVWDHSATTVNYGVNVSEPTDLLAPNVARMVFTGFRADGATVTTTAAEVQCLRIDVTVELPRATAGTRTVSSWAWVRSW